MDFCCVTWPAENGGLRQEIQRQFGDLKCKNFGGDDGWDWYVVEVDYGTSTPGSVGNLPPSIKTWTHKTAVPQSNS